ncbi:hypothetical protein TNIN_131681 [Trichonephila inaurata madagascariensis]|uniref:Uncharacterized protein n=1 Tax=Trichonephila inaurata madagascariensis TaxID=2747483 RepID=A0A8X6YHC1_9ARAC|nr:hypothetical protein TNIN_131681 [Trichonephila inaurata madagascariensis]
MKEFSLRMFTDILWKASKGIFDISALIRDSAFASKRDLNFTTLPHSPPISDLIGYNGSKNVFPEWKETSDSRPFRLGLYGDIKCAHRFEIHPYLQ